MTNVMHISQWSCLFVCNEFKLPWCLDCAGWLGVIFSIFQWIVTSTAMLHFILRSIPQCCCVRCTSPAKWQKSHFAWPFIALDILILQRYIESCIFKLHWGRFSAPRCWFCIFFFQTTRWLIINVFWDVDICGNCFVCSFLFCVILFYVVCLATPNWRREFSHWKESYWPRK
jgi:hypothetical protein